MSTASTFVRVVGGEDFTKTSSIIKLQSFLPEQKGGYAGKGPLVNRLNIPQNTDSRYYFEVQKDALYLFRLTTNNKRRIAVLIELEQDRKKPPPKKQLHYEIFIYGFTLQLAHNLIVRCATVDTSDNIDYVKNTWAETAHSIQQKCFNAFYFASFYANQLGLLSPKHEPSNAKPVTYDDTHSISKLRKTGFYSGQKEKGRRKKVRFIDYLNDNVKLPRGARWLAELNGVFLCILPSDEIVFLAELIPEIVKHTQLRQSFISQPELVEKLDKQGGFLKSLGSISDVMLTEMKRWTRTED